MSTVTVRLSNCHASDHALWCNLPDAVFKNHRGTITADTHQAIERAQRLLGEEPNFDYIAVASSLDADRLFKGLEASDVWRTGATQFVVHAFGVYVRLTHEDNRQAELEFDVHDRSGKPLVLANQKREGGA